jgi:DNA helicase-4
MDNLLLLLLCVAAFIGLCILFAHSANKKKYQNEIYLKYLPKIDDFFAIIKSLDDYLTWKQRDTILLKFKEVGNFFKGKSEFYKKELKVKKFNEIFQNFPKWTKQYNSDFVRKQKILLKDYFDDIENKTLDDQQRNAVITDEYSNLIIAGAGSGKTLTILGKVKYLVEKKNISPDKILLLSFTNKTVDELNSRLKNLRLGATATTFHKLGYNFVKMLSNKAPAVANENLLNAVIKTFLKKDILTHKSALESCVQFMAC